MGRSAYAFLSCCALVVASATAASCGQKSRDFGSSEAGEGGEAGRSRAEGGAAGESGEAGEAGSVSETGGQGGTVATGGAGGSGATGCSAITKPTNVTSKDFQCLDFDDGTLGSFASTASGGGNVESVTDLAFSTPRSVKVTIPNAASRASLTWTAVGSTQVTSVSVKAKINPAALGTLMPEWKTEIPLLCVHLGSATDCLDYDGKVLLLYLDYEGDSAMALKCPVSGNLAAGLWNDVELRITPAKVAELLIGGALKTSSCAEMHDADTSVTATVGLSGAANTSAWTVNYDDIVVAVTR